MSRFFRMMTVAALTGTIAAPLPAFACKNCDHKRSFAAEAASVLHDHPVKHGMVLFGSGPFFASHIVYKAPHNYQVILELPLSMTAQSAYYGSKMEYPDDQVILVLDAIDIGRLASERPDLMGTLFRENRQGERVAITESFAMPSGTYQVIYFDELPLSLESQAGARP